jgi:hypothetical protein
MQSALAQAGTRVRAITATTAKTDHRVVHPTRRSSLITEAPSSWRDAQRRPDAETWAVAHNREIERHEHVLKTWRLEPPLPKDTPRPFIFTYKFKKNAEGATRRRTMRCAIRGDLMQASQEYDPARTSAHTPSHTARRLLISAAAAAGHASNPGTCQGCTHARRPTQHTAKRWCSHHNSTDRSAAQATSQSSSIRCKGRRTLATFGLFMETRS